MEQIKEKQAFLSQRLRKAKLNFRCHEATSSIMEGVFSRGDRRTAETLIRAFELGSRMDGWQEFHNLEIWDQALAETGLTRAFFNERRRDPSEILPWDHIDCGVLKEWLWDDWMHSLEEGDVSDCSEDPCYDCGVCDHMVIHNAVFDNHEAGSKPKHRAKKTYIKRSAEDLNVIPIAQLKHRAKEISEAAPKLSEKAETTANSDPWANVYDVSLPKERRTRFRVRYAKRGLQSLSSHMEAMANLHRAFKRADAPVVYTKGMHPRMKTNQSPPIPMGAMSEAEFMDVEIRTPYSPHKLEIALTDQLPEGLDILSIEDLGYGPPAISNSLQLFQWRVAADSRETLENVVKDWKQNEPKHIVIERKGKSRDVDLRGQVHQLWMDEKGLMIELHAQGGARLRDVLKGIVGCDPLETNGWTLTKTDVSFEVLPDSNGENSTVPSSMATA